MFKAQKTSFILFFFIGSIGNLLFAQSNNAPTEPIQIISPDRPGGSPGPAKIDKGVLNLEGGMAFTTIKQEDLELKNQEYIGVIRYGLLTNLELNVSFTALSEKSNLIPDSKIRGIGPVALGAKIKVADEKGIFPAIEFDSKMTLSYFGKDAFTPADVEPAFNFNFQNTLNDKTTLMYGVGMEWEGAEEAAIYGFMVYQKLNEKFYTYIENYGTLRGDFRPESHFQTAIIYLPSNKLQFDMFFDIGFGEDKTRFSTIGLGMAWMLKEGNPY